MYLNFNPLNHGPLGQYNGVIFKFNAQVWEFASVLPLLVDILCLFKHDKNATHTRRRFTKFMEKVLRITERVKSGLQRFMLGRCSTVR